MKIYVLRIRKIPVLLAAALVLAGAFAAGLPRGEKPEAVEAFAPQASEAERGGRQGNRRKEAFVPTFANVRRLTTMKALQDHLYNIEETAYVTRQDINIDELLARDFKTDLTGGQPKVLIFHTHSQEAFCDSRPGELYDGVVGVGGVLAEILARDYGVAVVHDHGSYDVKGGVEDRSESYANMEPAVKKLLEKYPSVEVVIDLHRDGAPENMKFVTEIDGEPTAKIMFVAGITRLNDEGRGRALPALANPYLYDNLALSLQMQLTANELYPGFARRIYIKPYRYSLHMLPKSLLIEVGGDTSTLEEAKNAMAPLARVIAAVFGS